ncbi:OmpA family protein [Kaarinaea lacus]
MHKNNKLINNSNPKTCLTLALVSILAAGCGSTGGSISENQSQAQKEQARIALDPDGDVDNDGVVNAQDQCNDTLPKTWIDLKGCDLDTDGDKIADSRDACRGTPRGVKVDARGCGFDDDHDGVPNFRDRCSQTIANVSVNANGCEWDSDNDSVVDSKDLCAGTPPGVKVEPMGCHIIEVVTLEGVHFKPGSDQLSANAKEILKSVARTLRKHNRMRVEVAGHTDSTGPVEMNTQLSLQRARAASKFLMGLGVSKEALSTRGYAANQPVASNDTESGRSANRRVEMRFIEID